MSGIFVGMTVSAHTPSERAMLEVARRLRRDNPHLAFVEGGRPLEAPHLRVSRNHMDELVVGLHDGLDSFVIVDSLLTSAKSRGHPVSVRVTWAVDGADDRVYRDDLEFHDIVDGRDLVQRVMPIVDHWRRARIHLAETRVTHSDARFREVRALLFTVLDELQPVAAARVRQMFGPRRIQAMRLESRYEHLFFFSMDPDTRALVEVEPCVTRDSMASAFAGWSRARSRLHCEAWGRTWSWAEDSSCLLQCLDVVGPEGSISLEPNEDVADVAFVRLTELRTMPSGQRPAPETEQPAIHLMV